MQGHKVTFHIILVSTSYSPPAWTAEAVKRMGLEWTMRDHGRPEALAKCGMSPFQFWDVTFSVATQASRRRRGNAIWGWFNGHILTVEGTYSEIPIGQ